MDSAASEDRLLDRSRHRLNSLGQSAVCGGISPASRRARDDVPDPSCHRYSKFPARIGSHLMAGPPPD